MLWAWSLPSLCRGPDFSEVLKALCFGKTINVVRIVTLSRTEAY